MGGALSRFKTGGGGYLSNVDGAVESVTFTSDRPIKAGAKPAKKDPNKRPLLFAKVSIQEDNKDDVTETHLLAGFADDWTISKDGKTITPVSEDAQLVAWGDLYPLIASMVTDGDYPEANLPSMKPGESISFENLEGQRFHFVRKVDEAKTAEKGKRKYKGKDGKEHETKWDYLAVSKWYSDGENESEPDIAEESDADRIKRRAGETVEAILTAAKDHTINFKDLKLKVTTTLKSGDVDKSDIRSYLDDEDNVEALAKTAGTFSYDRSAKNRPLTLS